MADLEKLLNARVTRRGGLALAATGISGALISSGCDSESVLGKELHMPKPQGT